MANTITNLIPTLYEALDTVSRELVGYVQAVSRDSTGDRAALNQVINIPIVPAITGGNISPGQTPPNDGDATIGNTTMTIQKSRYWPIRWNGEEQKSIGMSGMRANVIRDQFTQAMRAAVNEVEADLAALHIYASRAYGTYNATAFGTAADFTDFSNMARILDDNGAPTSNRKLVLGSAAMSNIRGKQSVLFKTNEAGTDAFLRRGILGQVQGWDIHNSAQTKTAVTVGTNSGSTTDTTGYAVGSTTITIASAGTGTIISGDIVTFTGDTNKYLVVTGDTNVANGGTIVLAEPGLRQALAASAITITTIAATTRNMAFAQSAIQLITRAPALVEGGDRADDRIIITDPVSGLSFEVASYPEYRQRRFEVCLAWGVKLVKPEHVAVLIGA